MKIVLYNFLQPEHGGGGVGVYVGNLASALRAQGHEIVLLNSGDRYGFLRRSPYLRTWFNQYRRFEIVNSPVVAPAFYAFDDPATYLESEALDPLAWQLRKKLGRVDVFHFHNIEGLTRGFFYAARKAFPEAKFLFSIHNYNLVCPQVNLWHRETSACEDHRGGEACATCLVEGSSSGTVKRWRRLSQVRALVNGIHPGLKKQLGHVKRSVKGALRRGLPRKPAHGGETVSRGPYPYAGWRQANADLCREVFDKVLAVSDRTRMVCTSFGLPSENLAVSYIGTNHKEAFLKARKRGDLGEGLHLAYLGYMRPDKGFLFLLDFFERMPAALAARVTLTVAARKDPTAELHGRLMAVAARLKGFRYFDGFKHDTLDTVLDGVNLGIVPPLWEDNLPQVAIEIVSRGVPILTSDRGGAREIASHPGFVFEAGSQDSLAERLAGFADGQVSLGAFWGKLPRLVSMDEHLSEMLGYYVGPVDLKDAA